MLARLCDGGHREGKKLREAARLWARGELTDERQDEKEQANLDEALAAFGLELEGSPPDADLHPFYLWPENVPAWNIFVDLRTQWREGFNGRTGLDYGAVIAHLRHGLRLPHRKFQEFYALVRVAEHGYLEGVRELREEHESQQLL